MYVNGPGIASGWYLLFFLLLFGMYCVYECMIFAERLETQYPSSISCFEIIILYIFRLDTHFCCNRKCTREFCDVFTVFIKRHLSNAACMYWIWIYIYIYIYASARVHWTGSSTLLTQNIVFFICYFDAISSVYFYQMSIAAFYGMNV